jgi:hypothetical protein
MNHTERAYELEPREPVAAGMPLRFRPGGRSAFVLHEGLWQPFPRQPSLIARFRDTPWSKRQDTEPP